MCVCVFLVKQGGLWRTYDSGSVGSSRRSSAAGRRGGKNWGRGGRERRNMQGKTSSDNHAPMTPKPPKARMYSTTRHQQSSTSTKAMNEGVRLFVCVCVFVCDITWESLVAVQEARGPALRGWEAQNQSWDRLRRPLAQGRVETVPAGPRKLAMG